jgi:hypothetical protein
MVDGFVCGACAESLAAVGALGPTFLERAVLLAKGYDWAEGMRLPGLQAWVATGRAPGEPWEWVEVAPPAPDLDPLTALRLEVADLRAEVAALREGAAR